MNAPSAGADATRADHLYNTGGCRGGTVTQASFVNKRNIQLVNDPIPLLGKGRYLFFVQKSYINICN